MLPKELTFDVPNQLTFQEPSPAGEIRFGSKSSTYSMGPVRAAFMKRATASSLDRMIPDV